MVTQPRDSEHELDALLRLAAARRLLEAVGCGEWMLDDYVLEHTELLIRQARRRIAIRGPERRAA